MIDTSIGNAIGNALPGSAATGAAPGSASDATQKRVREMAEQFEAMLMTQMLREMRQSMVDEEEDEKGLGKDTFTDTLETELGGVLSRAGGFGLADALSKAIQRASGDAAAEPARASLPGGLAPLAKQLSASRATTGPTDTPADSDAGLDAGNGTLQVPHGRVSSAFGWRSDPFNGTARFHDGIDVAQAYGQDVRAAAGGRVAFAGDRGSYGSTIIVDHPGGRKTLYAHLSATDVRAGDIVEPGQVIGKSGSSGRSTGPHLHFEVLDGGRPVDPVAVTASRVDSRPGWVAGD